MYIYIYRILLNKFVWYTLAIYTTVSLSLRRQFSSFRVSIFAHIFQLYTEKKKETDKGRKGDEGKNDERKETGNSFANNNPILAAPLGTPRRLRGAQQRRFVARRPRTASNTVPGR